MNTSSAPLSLIYVGDPMCSWCYGFGVPLGQLLRRFPDLQVQLVLGGLRAYNTQVMDNALKQKLRGAWAGVAERSGQPFSNALFDRDDFIYDTEPACRAVVTVREHAPALALDMYHAIQQAFYVDGRDVTKPAVLGEVWDEVRRRGKDNGSHINFLRDFDSDAMRQGTRDDFTLAQRWGIRGFPALLAVQGGQAEMLANGFTEADVLIERLAALHPDTDARPT